MVRRSTPADARAISTIRVAAWRAAYDGLIDVALLERLDVDRETDARTRHWDEHHADPRSTELIAEVGGRPAGYVVVGPSLTPDEAGAGQLYAINVLPTHWSSGVGGALIGAAEQALRAAGFDSAHLWVLEGNERAAAFYDRHGWVEDGVAKLDEDIVGDSGARPLHERRRVRDLRS